MDKEIKEKPKQDCGYVYIFTIPKSKKVKIGITNQTIKKRIDGIYNGNTGVPDKFQPYAFVELGWKKNGNLNSECKIVEKLILNYFDKNRPNKKREYLDKEPEEIFDQLEFYAKLFCKKPKIIKRGNTKNNQKAKTTKSSQKAKAPKKTNSKNSSGNYDFKKAGIIPGITILKLKEKKKDKGISVTLTKDYKFKCGHDTYYSAKQLTKEKLNIIPNRNCYYYIYHGDESLRKLKLQNKI